MALRQQQEYLVRNRTFPFLPCYCVHSPIAANRITKPFMTLRQQQEYLVFNRRFPFLPCYCLYSPIATNRTTKPFMTLLCDLQCVQPRRFANLRITPTIPKAELEAAHSRRRNLKRLIAAKTADMISHACRFIFINITLSNRIVKPNNRYTR